MTIEWIRIPASVFTATGWLTLIVGFFLAGYTFSVGPDEWLQRIGFASIWVGGSLVVFAQMQLVAYLRSQPTKAATAD